VQGSGILGGMLGLEEDVALEVFGCERKLAGCVVAEVAWGWVRFVRGRGRVCRPASVLTTLPLVRRIIV
jgi:hypothetical protein